MGHLSPDDNVIRTSQLEAMKKLDAAAFKAGASNLLATEVYNILFPLADFLWLCPLARGC
jgi:hypothetical protein